MATLISTADVIQPLGELHCDFFPKADLDKNVNGWVANAIQKAQSNGSIAVVDQASAAKAWVYYQAFSYLAGSFAAMPNSASVNKGADSVSYGQDRPTYWSNRAAAALADFNSLLTTQPLQDNRRSGKIKTIVEWC